MPHIGGWSLAKYFFEHSAEVIRIFITEPLADFRYIERGVPHKVNRLVHPQLRMRLDDALAREPFECRGQIAVIQLQASA
ncbi:hypothetical protein D3C80_1797760 [compost metagenome]